MSLTKDQLDAIGQFLTGILQGSDFLLLTVPDGTNQIGVVSNLPREHQPRMAEFFLHGLQTVRDGKGVEVDMNVKRSER